MTLPRLRFQCGGALDMHAVYVRRPADEELPRILLDGEFAYCLAPRQIGKSSLRATVARQLIDQGVHCVTLDLSTVGDRTTPAEQWYFDLIDKTRRQLKLEDPLPFWHRHGAQPPLSRWLLYMREEVLAHVPTSIVVFIDELDVLLVRAAVDREAFLAAIRSLYNARADDPACRRLLFCLLGVALPGDLIRDPAVTPLNVGQSVLIEDFTRGQMDALLAGFEGLPLEGACILDAIYKLTHGHPAFTLKLCEQLRRRARAGTPPSVEDLAQELFRRQGHSLESNLDYAEKWFRRDSQSPRVTRMLQLYGRLRSGEIIPADGGDEIQLALRLTGMAAERNESDRVYLRVRNPIFAQIFDESWVRAQQGDRWISEPVRLWREASRNADFLLRGQALEVAQDWAAHREDLHQEERDFLRASGEAAQAERRAATRVLRRNVGILVALTTLLFVSLLGALWQFNEAQRARQDALLEERGARATLLAKLPGQESKAMLTALAAFDEAQSGRKRSAVASGLTAAVQSAELLTTLRGHAGPVLSAGFLSDGSRVITMGGDRTVRLWSVKEPRSLPRIFRDPLLMSADRSHVVLRKQSGLEVWDLAPSVRLTRTVALPESITIDGIDEAGARFLSLRDGVAHMHDLANGRELSAIAIPDRVPGQLSPDGQRLVSRHPDHTVRLWDAKTGHLIHVLRGHTGKVIWSEFSRDSTQLLTGGQDRAVLVWDLTRPDRTPLPLKAHNSLVMRGSFSADGRRALTASEDETAILWDLSNGRPLHVYRGHSDGLAVARLSADDQYIVTPSWDQTARLWSTHGDQELAVLRGHRGAVYCADFSANAKRVVTAGEDHVLRMWDVPTGTLRDVLKGHADGVHDVLMLPDGEHLWSVSTDGTSRLWESRVRELHRFDAKDKRLTAVAVSPDGRQLAAGGADAEARLWNSDGSGSTVALTGHQDGLTVLAFSPDGGSILSGSRDGVLRVYDARSGVLSWATPKHRSPIFYGEFSPDGRQIVTICDNEQGRIWDAHTGVLLRELDNQPSGPLNVTFPYATFSPDSRLLVTTRRDGSAKLWDVRGSELPFELRGHEGAVVHAAFSPDGKRLLTAGHDSTARLWDLRSRRELLRLTGHTAEITTVVFSPSGETILTTSLDGTARLWEARSGAELLFVEGYFENRGAAGFSPDGTRLILATRDNSAMILPVDLHEQLKLGCRFLQNEQLDTKLRNYRSICASAE